MSVEAVDILFKLSVIIGSAGNSQASDGPGSLGKYISTSQVSGALDAVFATISGDDNAAGVIDYRGLFIHNAHASQAALTPVVWVGGLDATALASTDVITCTGHDFVDGEAVRVEAELNTHVLPTGLASGTTYYVRDTSGATFKLAATLGGAAINITADGGAFCVRRHPTATYAIGVDPAAQSVIGNASAQAAEIANKNTAPSGVTFSLPVTKASAISLGATLDAGKCRGVWVRRTATNSAEDPLDGIILKVGWDTL